MASIKADSRPAPGNNIDRGTTSKPSPSPLSQQRCKAPFVSAKTDRDSLRSPPIIIPASDALLRPSYEQGNGHYNAAAQSQGGLHLQSIITSDGECFSPSHGPRGRHTHVGNPTSSKPYAIVSSPAVEHDTITHSSSISYEAKVVTQYGLSKGICFSMPSKSTLRVDSLEGDPKKIDSTITQDVECMSIPPGPKNWYIRAITPTSEAIVSLPPLFEGQNVISPGSIIFDETPDCNHYGSSRGMCPVRPSKFTLHTPREMAEPNHTFTQPNGFALDNGMPSDATSQPQPDSDQHQIISWGVCLWMIHLHNNLKWIGNLAKAVVHITQQTYFEMNRAMSRFFLYLLINHWVEEVIKWVLAWRLVFLQLNNPQHGVGHYFVTLKHSVGICILQHGCVGLLSLRWLLVAVGVGPLQSYLRNDCLKPLL
jgi:hypothetical protein